MIKIQAGKNAIPVHFGWRQLTECNRVLKNAPLNKLKDIDVEKDSDEINEAAIDLGLEMFDSQCVIATIGLKQGHLVEFDAEIDDRQADKIIDDHPEIVQKVWEHFLDRFKAFMNKAAVNPVKELQEKKRSAAAK